MPGREPRILQSAWEDLEDIADHLARVSGECVAEEATDATLDTIEPLTSTPLLGSLHHDPVLQQLGYCKLICGRYVCVYRKVEDAPVAYRMFHERRDFAWRLG